MRALTYLLFVVVVCSTIFAFYRTTLLPVRFLYDSQRLQQFIVNPGLIVNDGSYRATAMLWRGFTNGSNDQLVGLLTYVLFLVALFSVVKPSWIVTGSIGPYLLTLISLVLAAVYASGYTKEFFVVIVVFVVLRAPHSLVGEIAGIAMMVLYAAAVRPYWAIIVGLYLVLRVMTRTRRPILGFLGVAVGALVVLNLAFPVITGFTIDGYRSSIVDVLSVMPNSAISGPFDGTSFTFQVANSLTIFAGLQLPLHLMLNSSVQALGAVAIMVVWFQFWTSMRRCRRTDALVGDVVLGRAASLMFAVLIALCTFEPDYGSYLRHLVPLLPAAIYVASALRSTTVPKGGQVPISMSNPARIMTPVQS